VFFTKCQYVDLLHENEVGSTHNMQWEYVRSAYKIFSSKIYREETILEAWA